MKNKILLCVCLCLTLCFSSLFVACDVDYSKYAGEYYLKSVTYETGTSKTVDELVEEGVVADKDLEYISLASDQYFLMLGIIGDSEGNYSISSNAITFMWFNRTVVSYIENNTITINVNGNNYTYQRGN